MSEREITSRIQREELLGLLHETSASEQQRITARMSAVLLDTLLEPEPVPPPPIAVTFRPPIATGSMPRLDVAGAGGDGETDRAPTTPIRIADPMLAAVDAAIDAAVDAATIDDDAIDAAIEAAVGDGGGRPCTDATTGVYAVATPAELEPPPARGIATWLASAPWLLRVRVGVVALSFILSFFLGIAIMFLL